MPNKITSLAAKFKRRHIQKRKSYAVLTLLALVVVVGTVGVLVRPASTMSGELVCGLEEHRHTEECYERTLACGQEESEEHTHTEACWQAELICQIPEHTHMDECYAAVSESEDQLEDETADQQEDTVKEPSADEPEKAEEAQNNETPVEAIEKLPASVPADYTDLREAKIPEGGHVRVYARPGTLPDNVTVKAQLLSEESTEYAQAVQRLQTAGVTYDFVTALDISLYNEQGEKVEPDAPVYVEIEAGSLLSRDADPTSVQIQHHKEILPSAQPEKLSEEESRPELLQNTESEVVLETVVDPEMGLLTKNTEDGSFTATFQVDSFSIYTITSEGWKELKIKVHCVDEVGDDIPIAPKDVVLNKNHVSSESFGIDFASGENKHQKIEGYQFDNKAYYMEDGHYVKRIYGIRREKNTWYYFHSESNGAPNPKSKVAFNPQPDFYGENPKNTIRLVYKKVSEIPVEYLEWMSYTALPAADAPGGENPSSVGATGHSLDISNVDAWPKSNTYFFTGRAYVGERNPANEISSVIAKDGKLYAVTAEAKEIELTKDNPLRLLYAKTQTDKIPTIPTVSTRDKGLIINLFDYNSGVNDNAGVTCGPNDGINANKDLQFVKDLSRSQEYNKWTGKDGGIYTGIVQDQLDANGYPVMQSGQSLDYLFDPQICEAQLGKTVKHLHTDLDHLFWQDRDGYYRYDSMTNFATIMDETADGDGGHKPGHIHGGNFVVYAQPALPGSHATGDNPKFLPFNKYTEANRVNLGHNKETIKQYHFGMTMEAEFLMPPGGEVVDADGNHVGLRDMIFEFNGDDDVWLFVDGKLALDLGGIHDRYGGTINFRTGEVRTNAPPMEHSGLRQKNLYGIPADKEGQLTPEEIAAYRDKAGFGSYTKHTFKFFYLERGRGASNCEIRFNLVPVAHRLVVGKRLPPENEYDHFTDISRPQSYKFRAEIQQPIKDGAKVGREPLRNAPFTVLRWDPAADQTTGGIPVRPGKTDEEGYFWLRADERAQFTDVIDLKDAGNMEGTEDDVHIYVSEILPAGHSIGVNAWDGDATRDGTYQEVPNAAGGKDKVAPPLYDMGNAVFHNERTKAKIEKRVVNDGEIAFEVCMNSGRHNEVNWVDFENDLGSLASLNITKQALHTDGKTPVTGVSFPMKVELWDEMDELWVPLSAGSPYWILDPGEAPPADGAKPEFHLDAQDNGLISIEHGQTIHLKLLPGTKYRVMEMLTPEEDQTYETTYEGVVKNPSAAALNELKYYTQDDQPDGKQIGIGSTAGVKAGSVHTITVTNQGDPILPPELYIKKMVQGYAPDDMLFSMQIKVKSSADAQGVPLPDGTPYTITANGVEGETQQVTGGKGIIQIHKDETIHLVMTPNTLYSVEEVNLNKGFVPRYEWEVSLKKWQMIQQDTPLKDIPLNNNEVHNVIVTNHGNAIEMPKGSFALTKELLGDVQPPANTHFPFHLRINGYDGQQAELVCNVTYYGTPEGERTNLGPAENGALRDQVIFRPAAAGDGSSGGKNYEADLFLHPHETVVITNLPQGYSMYVQEVLGDESGNYDVSFQEEGGTVVPGNELAQTSNITDAGVVHVICTNQSKLQPSSTLQITKQVKRTDQPDGAPTAADQQKEFNFAVTLKASKDFAGGDMTAKVEKDGAVLTEKTLHFQKNGEDYTANVTLKHGETLTIPGLPTWVDAVIQETNREGYATSMNGIPGASTTVHLKANSGTPYKVICVNTTGVEIPETGGHGQLPYYLLGTALMLCAGGLLLYQHRRKKRA